MDHHHHLKGPNRRSRKVVEGRDFDCGCGKAYLSYPALLTHIKTKHEGKQPEGTLKTGTISTKRQRKYEYDEKLIKEIVCHTNIESFRILKELDENAKGVVKFGNRIKKESVGKEIFEAFNEIMKQDCLMLSKGSSIEEVLVVYLLGAGEYVSDCLFDYYTQFAVLFRNCFKDCVQEVYDFCFKKSQSNQTKLNLEECKLAPIVCDFFLRFYAPYESKDIDFLSAIQVISFDFCNWMYEKKLSIVEVTMKNKCISLRKNLINARIKRAYRKRGNKEYGSIKKYLTKVREERVEEENEMHEVNQIELSDESVSQESIHEQEQQNGVDREEADEDDKGDEDEGDDDEEELENEEEEERENKKNVEKGKDLEEIEEKDRKLIEESEKESNNQSNKQNSLLEHIQEQEQESKSMHDQHGEQQMDEHIIDKQPQSHHEQIEEENQNKENVMSENMVEEPSGDCQEKKLNERLSEYEGCQEKEKISEKEQYEEEH